MLRIALLLQTIGFFVTAILVFLIKWNVIKPKADRVKSYIVGLRLKLTQSLSPMMWLLSHIATDGAKYPIEQLKLWQAPFYVVGRILHTFVIAPLLLILLTILLLPFYIIVFLSQHNAITNSLIVLGTTAALTGLIIELIINW